MTHRHVNLLTLNYLALKKERERLGLTVAELAYRSNLAPMQVKDLEDYVSTNPTLKTISKLTRGLGKETDPLFLLRW